MQSPCDRTGFPTLTVPPLGVRIHLLPVTKMQFERFLADSRAWGDAAYDGILAENPRVSPYRFMDENRENLFATGILPCEAEAFAKWLGPGWHIPSQELWRRLWQGFSNTAMSQAVLDTLPEPAMCPAATAIVRGILRQVSPTNVLEFTLMRGGVVEWVSARGEWVGLGQPRAPFGSYLADPLRGAAIVPIERSVRVKSFGFRLYCDMEAAAGGADGRLRF